MHMHMRRPHLLSGSCQHLGESRAKAVEQDRLVAYLW